MAVNIENKLLAVIRVRGRIGVRRSITETLNRLNLTRVNNMVLVYGTKSNIGMLQKCGDFITYGEIEGEFAAKILEKKGVKVSKEDLDAMASGKKRPKDVLQLPIGLHPPRHGYENTKQVYSRHGSLGYRGAEISKLLSRMT